MARPQKKGLDYFPFDVGFFSDKKVRALRVNYGTDGIAVYLYLLCSIYSEGYYIVDDSDLMDAMITDLGMKWDKIGQILNFLLNRSLLTSILIKSDKVLSSKGIQRRYQEGVRARALKNAVEVDGRIWLLNESETYDFIKVRPEKSFSEKNPGYSEKNHSFSENNDTKKSKEKKSKEKESKAHMPAANGFERFWEIYPKKIAEQEAVVEWNKLKADEELVEVILAAIARAKQSKQWMEENGRFIPYPANWLKQQRWKDEISPPVPTPPMGNGTMVKQSEGSSSDMDELERRINMGWP